jgi:hypothetical protein
VNEDVCADPSIAATRLAIGHQGYHSSAAQSLTSQQDYPAKAVLKSLTGSRRLLPISKALSASSLRRTLDY